MNNIRLAIVFAFLVGCGSPVKKDLGKDTGNNGQSNSTQNNTTQSAVCGDGIVNGDETCDPSLEGSCPDSCPQPTNCGSSELVGSADDCTAECVVTEVQCGEADLCCPAGCDSSTDEDCSNECGNGVVEAPELCDGDCPTQCPTDDACSVGLLSGDSDTCNSFCEYEPITDCADGDGCCPTGCGATVDDDCVPEPFCGDGSIDTGEICDGDCPTSCDDNQACTTDVMVGSPETCDAQCSNTPITTCVNGDGCCASGCTYANDNDCACTPRTCAQLGAECGTIDDGCGSTVSCSNTCGTNETCESNRCVEENFIGDSCSDASPCGSSVDAACIIASEWVGGYCTLLDCSSSADCPTGAHCGVLPSQGLDACLQSCTSSSQCRNDYECRQYDGFGGNECAPAVPAGSGVIGDLCDSNADCGSGLTCYQNVPDYQGGTMTFEGGLCSKPCSVGSSTCGNGNVCAREGICTTGCIFGDDCRPDFACVFNSQVLDSHCLPN